MATTHRASLPWGNAASRLTSVLAVPEWHEHARCAEVDPDLHFPDKGDSAAPAKKICFSCEVRVQCLNDSIERRDQYGVWGGHTERERRKMWMAADREAAAEQAALLEATA